MRAQRLFSVRGGVERIVMIQNMTFVNLPSSLDHSSIIEEHLRHLKTGYKCRSGLNLTLVHALKPELRSRN